MNRDYQGRLVMMYGDFYESPSVEWVFSWLPTRLITHNRCGRKVPQGDFCLVCRATSALWFMVEQMINRTTASDYMTEELMIRRYIEWQEMNAHLFSGSLMTTTQ